MSRGGARLSRRLEPRLERPDADERRLDALGIEPAAHEAFLNRGEGGPSGRAPVGEPIVGDEQEVRARRERRDGCGLEPPAPLDRAHPEIVGHDWAVEAELAAEEPREGGARERGGEFGVERAVDDVRGHHRVDQPLGDQRPVGGEFGLAVRRGRDFHEALVGIAECRAVPREVLERGEHTLGV